MRRSVKKAAILFSVISVPSRALPPSELSPAGVIIHCTLDSTVFSWQQIQFLYISFALHFFLITYQTKQVHVCCNLLTIVIFTKVREEVFVKYSFN